MRTGERVRCMPISWWRVSCGSIMHGGTEYNKTFFVPGMFPDPATALLTNEPLPPWLQALTPCTHPSISVRSVPGPVP